VFYKNHAFNFIFIIFNNYCCLLIVMIITYTIFLTYLLYNILFMMLSLWEIYFSSRDLIQSSLSSKTTQWRVQAWSLNTGGLLIQVKLVFKDHSVASPSMVSKHRWSLNTSQACLQRPLNGEFKHGLLT
jgi:hypothetical protein